MYMEQKIELLIKNQEAILQEIKLLRNEKDPEKDKYSSNEILTLPEVAVMVKTPLHTLRKSTYKYPFLFKLGGTYRAKRGDVLRYVDSLSDPTVLMKKK